MLHPFSDNVSKTSQVSLRIFLFLVSCLISTQVAHAVEDVNQIVSLKSKINGNQTEIRLEGVRSFVSSVYELPKPERVVVDIADAVLADHFVVPNDLPFRVAATKVPGTSPVITRFEFFIPGLVSFTSKQEGVETFLVVESKESPTASLNADLGSSANSQTQFSGVHVRKSKNQTVIQIDFDHKIVNFKKEITAKNAADNPSLIIDVDQVSANDQLLTTTSVNTAVTQVIAARRGSGVRFTLVSASDALFPYRISKKDNGLEIVIEESVVKDQVSKIIGQHQNIENQLPDIKPLEAKLSPQAREQQMQDAFNFSGYQKDRISVEFQKMDLHNVFNFLRQVSGVNIVVDESVQGSLTLVLDDVPWDFALDIILNLKGLDKEERFNTLVIYPKGKGFKWPEQAENNLSFEADSAVIEKEALVIQQQDKQPEGVVDAKEFIAKGLKAEKREDFENAVVLYERALDKWPTNVHLANKISAIYLVKLQQNAKAMYFAQRALKIDPNNQVAFLNAGIACANMQDTSQADHYFSRSVQTGKPMQEALLNYAAFKEERASYREALSLLSRHDQLYGKSLDSMIAAARITDKMGDISQASKLYRAILTSGFRVPPDLAKYIQGRVSLKSSL